MYDFILIIVVCYSRIKFHVPEDSLPASPSTTAVVCRPQAFTEFSRLTDRGGYEEFLFCNNKDCCELMASKVGSFRLFVAA